MLELSVDEGGITGITLGGRGGAAGDANGIGEGTRGSKGEGGLAVAADPAAEEGTVPPPDLPLSGPTAPFCPLG